MKTLTIKTNLKIEWIDITEEVQEVVGRAKTERGLATVFVPHTTAGITINEHADPTVIRDINNRLNEIVPEDGSYAHKEGNSPGHIKASLMGSSQSIIIKDGILQLGTWQGIFFCEFDGPRNRQVYVKVIGEK
jgi:secondary thiamine-phosphate synthase enzyme